MTLLESSLARKAGGSNPPAATKTAQVRACPRVQPRLWLRNRKDQILPPPDRN